MKHVRGCSSPAHVFIVHPTLVAVVPATTLAPFEVVSVFTLAFRGIPYPRRVTVIGGIGRKFLRFLFLKYRGGDAVHPYFLVGILRIWLFGIERGAGRPQAHGRLFAALQLAQVFPHCIGAFLAFPVGFS